MALVVEKTSQGWMVMVDGKVADCLSKDEALGVVAHHLFCSEGAAHPYVKTLDEWRAWRARQDEDRGEACPLIALVIAPAGRV